MTVEPTVFLVDNDPATHEALHSLTRSMGLPFEPYSSGWEFLDCFDPARPGCLVSEVRIADISGPQIQRRLLAQGAVLPVIFLTAYAQVPVVVRTMKAGAVNFLEKPFAEQDLWETIQQAIRLDQARRREHARRRQWESRLARLTASERQVLDLVVRGKQNREIADLQRVSVRTVELRRARVMKKLGASSLVELITVTHSIKDGHCSRFDIACTGAV